MRQVRLYIVVVLCLAITACFYKQIATTDETVQFVKTPDDFRKLYARIHAGMTYADLASRPPGGLGIPLARCERSEEPHMRCLRGIEALKEFFGPTVFGNLFAETGSDAKDVDAKLMALVRNAQKRYQLVQMKFHQTTTNTRGWFFLVYKTEKKSEHGINAHPEIFLRDGVVIYKQDPGGPVALEERKRRILDADMLYLLLRFIPR